jgi:type I restriction enzyme M protein
MPDKALTVSVPLRRMTQAELDAFLEKAADILRGNVDHSEFRGYVFALLFFKRISDVFEESVRKLARDMGDELANDPTLQKKSLPFVVPADSLWATVTGVPSTQLGQALNDAMLAIERANAPKFDGILTSKIDFNKQDELPRGKLVELTNHFSGRRFDKAHVPDDVFGNAYEYLIRTFASKAGKSSGEFYTPREVSYLMSEIIEPAEQHEVCDWASGSGSLLLQCREYVRRHGQDPNRLFLFAQESNVATYNISRINLILHGVNSWNPRHGDSLRDPKHLTSDHRLKAFDRGHEPAFLAGELGLRRLHRRRPLRPLRLRDAAAEQRRLRLAPARRQVAQAGRQGDCGHVAGGPVPRPAGTDGGGGRPQQEGRRRVPDPVRLPARRPARGGHRAAVGAVLR